MKKLHVVSKGVVLAFAFVVALQAQTGVMLQRSNLANGSAADLTVMLEAVEATTPTPAESVPRYGTFYSARMPFGPPLPVPMGWPAWNLGDGMWLVDDLDFDGSAGVQAAGMRAMSLAVSGPPGFGGDGNGGTNSYPSTFVPLVFTTNDLWLALVLKAGSTANLQIHPPWTETNGVYDLFYMTNLAPSGNWSWLLRCEPGQTNLAVSSLSDAEGFFILGLTNDADADGMSDVFEKLVSHTDPGNGDQNTNGIPDSWEWKYFGTLTLSSNADYDGDGLTILQEYQQGVDPNKIRFAIEVTNNYMQTSLATAQLAVAGGVPSFLAVLVDSTNYAGAAWTSYTSSNITIPLGAEEGWHEIWTGLRGLPADAQPTWQWKRLKLDLTPPLLVITNPIGSVVTQPMIQLQGYSPEALSRISCDLTNATGLVTNQQVLVLDQFYDTNTWEFTTNTFQAFDVPLTNGLNIITLHATDLAGNVTTTNFSFTLDYSNATNPPAMQITWPQDGTQISGGSFTCDGFVSDPTATVSASITDPNGQTNVVAGLVERNGRFWVENLPLHGGTNVLILTAADAAGNVTATNIAVVQSALVLTLNPVTADLWQPAVNVSGTISEASQAVWINGVKGTNHGDGTWSADNVPVNPGGTASFTVTAYAPTEQQPDGSFGN